MPSSAYYPILSGIAAFADQRTIGSLSQAVGSPRIHHGRGAGHTAGSSHSTISFSISGKREAKIDAAAAEKPIAGANFIRANQEVAFWRRHLHITNCRLRRSTSPPRRKLGKTAQTTQDAAEAQLNNGRSTLPDVLNARAETAQAVFEYDELQPIRPGRATRVALTEAIGAEPSPNIIIDRQDKTSLPQALTMTSSKP